MAYRISLRTLGFDLSQLGDDLLGQFFLSAWRGMPSFGFDTDRISLWKWCRLRGAGQNGLASGCYPLDEYYKRSPDGESLRAIKSRE